MRIHLSPPQNRFLFQLSGSLIPPVLVTTGIRDTSVTLGQTPTRDSEFDMLGLLNKACSISILSCSVNKRGGMARHLPSAIMLNIPAP